DLCVVGEKLDDLVVGTRVERALERLVELAKRPLLLEQRELLGRIVRAARRGHHRGRRERRRARAELHEEGAAAVVDRAFVRRRGWNERLRHAGVPLFGPKNLGLRWEE